jgi:hypothetical protein
MEEHTVNMPLLGDTFPIVAANDSIALKMGMLHPGKGTNTVCA